MSYTQDPPNTIKVEMTEGCNLRCWFCGMNAIRGKDNDFKFMSAADARLVASQIAAAGWNSRIEFTGRGEPTANPACADVVRAFRGALPKASIMLSTNGGFLAKADDPGQAMERLFVAGVNTLVVERYENQKFADIIKASASSAPSVDILFSQHEYPAERDARPNDKMPHTVHRVVYLQDIGKAEKGTHSSVQNQCGVAAPLNDSCAGKRCAKPFREMVVRHDLKVTLCCNDWQGRAYIGSLRENTMAALWQNEKYMAARAKLIRGERTFAPCRGCTDTSYRVGLLPDKLGKKDMPAPTARDEALLLKMSQQTPLTPIARQRPWMK